MANNIDQLYGDYSSDVMGDFASTPLVGLLPLSDNVAYAAGCEHSHSTICEVRVSICRSILCFSRYIEVT